MTTARDLLAACRRAGVELSAAGGRLRYLARKGALTEALRSELALRHDELLPLVGPCPGCHRPLREGRCWRCGYRPCACGRSTGSAFIELCLHCQAGGEGKTPSRWEGRTDGEAT